VRQVTISAANFSISLVCFLATPCTRHFPTYVTVLVLAHRTPCCTTRCGVSVCALCAVHVVWCFSVCSAHSAVFHDTKSEADCKTDNNVNMSHKKFNKHNQP